MTMTSRRISTAPEEGAVAAASLLAFMVTSDEFVVAPTFALRAAARATRGIRRSRACLALPPLT